MGFTIYYWMMMMMMMMIALLLLTIHTAATITGIIPRPASVNVGAIFPFNSTIGKVASIAIKTAVDDVNADPNVLRGTQIKLAMEDSERSGFLGVVETIQFMQHDTVAIIGPQSSVIAHVVSHISTELQVPMLSFASTDPTLSSLQYPFFIRTTQNDLFQMSAIADLINHYGWREVIAIYTDDDFGRNGIASLSDKLSEQRCRISYKAAMRPDLNRDDITSVLLKVALTECRVMILHTYNAYGMEVLDVARHLEMLGSGFVWIATNWLTDVIDTYSPLPSEQMELIQGMITLRMYTPDSSLKRRFVSRWQRNLTVKDEGSGIQVLGLNTYGLYAYDSVWILARALDAYFSHGGNLSFSPDEKLRHLEKGGPLHLDALSIFDGGKDLLNDILDVNMSGITGRVAFKPDRELMHPAYEIVNVIGTGHRRIGYWSNSSGLSTQPPEVLWLGNGTKPNPKLYGVVWPGQNTERPRGWVFPNSGKRLRVGVPNRVSFKEFISYNKGTGGFNGYCIDVLMGALNVLPYAIPYELIPVGNGKKNPSINQLISDLATGVYDAVVGDIAITTNRTKYADFTQPYIESGLVVVAPVRTMKSSAWAFLRPFTPMMWAVTAISFLVVGVVMWILEHRINDDFRGPPKRQFVTILWFSFSTLFFAHKEKTVSTLGRLVLIIWLFVVLIINSSYTASLTSILTVQQLSSPIKGIESLMANREPIGIQQGSFARNYLTQQLNIHESRLVELGSVDSYAEALRKGPKNGGVGAVVDERAYIELFLSTRCDFTIVGDEFTKNGWGFAFPRDSPLAVDMTTALLKLSEEGDLQRIHDKWLMRSACRSQGSTLSVDRLELRSFLGLFLICGLSCLLALFAYFYNTIKQFMGYSPSEEEKEKEKEVSSPPGSTGGDSGSAGIMGSKSGRRLAKFLSFADEKEEVARSRSRKRQEERMCSKNSVAAGDASPSINGSCLRSTVDVVGSNKCVGMKCEA